MEQLDEAKEIEQQHRTKSIEAVIEKVNQKGTKECVDCCLSIPPARRNAYPAATRCIECQSNYERHL